MLTWNKDDFGGIQKINVDPAKVWLPDIVLYNKYVHVLTLPFHERKSSLYHERALFIISIAITEGLMAIRIKWWLQHEPSPPLPPYVQLPCSILLLLSAKHGSGVHHFKNLVELCRVSGLRLSTHKTSMILLCHLLQLPLHSLTAMNGLVLQE